MRFLVVAGVLFNIISGFTWIWCPRAQHILTYGEWAWIVTPSCGWLSCSVWIEFKGGTTLHNLINRSSWYHSLPAPIPPNGDVCQSNLPKQNQSVPLGTKQCNRKERSGRKNMADLLLRCDFFNAFSCSLSFGLGQVLMGDHPCLLGPTLLYVCCPG